MAAAHAPLRKRVGFIPHMTLFYRDGASLEHPIPGFEWFVDELTLIHSRVGGSRHETLRRWPLRVPEPLQCSLFRALLSEFVPGFRFGQGCGDIRRERAMQRDDDLYREQPDSPFIPDNEAGVHSWPVGSFAPIGTYRPIPIAWFAGVLFLHPILLLLLMPFLVAQPLLVSGGATGLASFVVGWWTFRRGMGRAGRGWRIATVVTILVYWGLAVLVLAAV